MCCCCWSCFDLRNRTIFLYTDESNNNTNPNFSNNRLKADMEVGIDGGKVSNERIAGKLKGYFDLAKEEIAKVVRAEEWGLNDEAISRYMNAQRILVEGASAHAPSFISSRNCGLTLLLQIIWLPQTEIGNNADSARRGNDTLRGSIWNFEAAIRCASLCFGNTFG